MIAEIKLFSNKEVNVIEVEREDKAISALIITLYKWGGIVYIYQSILNSLLNNDTWDKRKLNFNNINFLNLRHGKSDKKHRASNNMSKITRI